MALAVTDDAMLADLRALAREEGLSAAPEGAATLAAVRQLLERGVLDRDDRIVLFNTGASWKYAELLPLPDVPVVDPDDPAALDRLAS
jgi:threonine synthase